MCRVIPASWHQTGTFQRGRRSSRSANAAENQCSCLEGSQAFEPHEPSVVPYRPSQNLLHLSRSEEKIVGVFLKKNKKKCIS